MSHFIYYRASVFLSNRNFLIENVFILYESISILSS